MRDLEIRGAGNLLGAEQHGQIESVGYDLYMKLLNEAILEEKGEKIKERAECTVSLNIDAYIPEKYIRSAAQRIDAYKKIATICSEEDVTDVRDELTDRYGTAPKSVERLLDVALCRALAARSGIKRVELRGNTILFIADKPDIATWSEIYDKYKNGLIPPSATAPVAYRMRANEDPTVVCRRILTDYYKAANQ
jgi:transcription-repair coupling factor (superfamily II helicase)